MASIQLMQECKGYFTYCLCFCLSLIFFIKADFQSVPVAQSQRSYVSECTERTGNQFLKTLLTNILQLSIIEYLDETRPDPPLFPRDDPYKRALVYRIV